MSIRFAAAPGRPLQVIRSNSAAVQVKDFARTDRSAAQFLIFAVAERLRRTHQLCRRPFWLHGRRSVGSETNERTSGVIKWPKDLRFDEIESPARRPCRLLQ